MDKVLKYQFSSKFPQSIHDAMYKNEKLIAPMSTGIYANEEVKSLSRERYIYLSVKQVPSALLLRHPGNSSIRRNLDELLQAGFHIEELDDKGYWRPVFGADTPWFTGLSASQVSVVSSLLNSVKDENARLGLNTAQEESFEESLDQPDDDSDITSEEEDQFESNNPAYHSTGRGIFRFCMVDPFKAQAAVELAVREGRKPPELVVWSGDVYRLQDDIPKRLLGSKYQGKGRKGSKFYSLRDGNVQMHVITKHTHWGAQLLEWVLDRSCVEHGWAKRLHKKIKYFLAGMHDPSWTSSKREVFYGVNPEIRERRKRSLRFLQMLKTIDGVFVQKYLAYPEAGWSWHKYDRFILGMISVLLPEEFHDGEISEVAIETVKSAYASIKEVRKHFKDSADRRRVSDLVTVMKSESDPIHRIFLVEYNWYSLERDTYRELMIRGYLSQTRAAGTPPPIESIRSRIKFIETVTVNSVPLSIEEDRILSGAIGKLLSDLPDDAFFGLQTKAGVRITTAASFEKTRAEGGSAQAVNDYLYEANIGRKARILNLNDGTVIEEKLLSELTVGEYIFWRSLENVLATPIESLREAFMVGVSEPGKTRVVTKARVSLKVVLDLVNGICSWPLAKGFESSLSGMTRESHGWNFFKEFFKHASELFQVKTRERTQTGAANFIEEMHYQDVFVSSTDYKTATDNLDHNVARKIGTAWMSKCGIPAVLKGIVVAVCYHPRTIFFSATGCMKGYGDPVKGVDSINKILLRKGVLMGDPLTKVVLHLINILVRYSTILCYNDVVRVIEKIQKESEASDIL